MASPVGRRTGDGGTRAQTSTDRYVGDVVQELSDNGQDHVERPGDRLCTGWVREDQIPGGESRRRAGKIADAAIRCGGSSFICDPSPEIVIPCARLSASPSPI